jgi:hypothetical protein
MPGKSPVGSLYLGKLPQIREYAQKKMFFFQERSTYFYLVYAGLGRKLSGWVAIKRDLLKIRI